jgi:hypothetical protein
MLSKIGFGVVLTVILSASCSYCQDVIYTMKGEKIKADVEVIGTRQITYQKYQSARGVKRTLPLAKVYMIRYENGEEEIFASSDKKTTDSSNYQSGSNKPDSGSQSGKSAKADGKPIKTLSSSEKCARGRADAKMFHGKGGAHLLYGFLFGPFATLGAALSSPSPESGSNTITQSENPALFEDPAYLGCYEKEAKGNNVAATLFGWLPLLTVILLL